MRRNPEEIRKMYINVNLNISTIEDVYKEMRKIESLYPIRFFFKESEASGHIVSRLLEHDRNGTFYSSVNIEFPNFATRDEKIISLWKEFVKIKQTPIQENGL